MVSVEERIGSHIWSLRMHLQWSQDDVGRQIGHHLDRPWSRQAVSAAEKGRRAFTAAELVAISKVFGVTLDQLVAEPPECRRCHGEPPFGFTCNTCGKIGER